MTRPPFDPRQQLRVARDGAWMSVFVDEVLLIDCGLVLEARHPLIALSECSSCGLWECNLVEGWAAKARRLGPYVLWVRASGEANVFDAAHYAAVLGPGVELLPELSADDAWDLLDPPDPEGGDLADIADWPARSVDGVAACAPPADAEPIPGGFAAQGASGAWMAFLPGLVRVPVWLEGEAVDRAVRQRRRSR